MYTVFLNNNNIYYEGSYLHISRIYINRNRKITIEYINVKHGQYCSIVINYISI